MGTSRIPLRHRIAAWLLDLEHVGWQHPSGGGVLGSIECPSDNCRPVWAARRSA